MGEENEFEDEELEETEEEPETLEELKRDILLTIREDLEKDRRKEIEEWEQEKRDFLDIFEANANVLKHGYKEAVKQTKAKEKKLDKLLTMSEQIIKDYEKATKRTDRAYDNYLKLAVQSNEVIQFYNKEVLKVQEEQRKLADRLRELGYRVEPV